MGGFATGTKASATEGDCFLGEVSRPSGLAVFAYVTATGIRIVAATRQVAVSTPGITQVRSPRTPHTTGRSAAVHSHSPHIAAPPRSVQFFRSLHSLFVEAVCNPLATGGPDDSAGVHLGSPWFKAALAERVNQANIALQYKPLPTPSVPPPLPGTGRAQGTRVAQAFEAYASGRSQA